MGWPVGGGGRWGRGGGVILSQLRLSEKSPYQSPPLGLDPREGGAGLIADWLRAQGGVAVFSP